MTDSEITRQNTRQTVLEAANAIKSMPAHYKTMVGAYTTPLMIAILAINAELEAIQEGQL